MERRLRTGVLTPFRWSGWFGIKRVLGGGQIGEYKAKLYDIFFSVCLALWIFEARHARKVSVLGAQSSIVSATEPPKVPQWRHFLWPKYRKTRGFRNATIVKNGVWGMSMCTSRSKVEGRSAKVWEWTHFWTLKWATYSGSGMPKVIFFIFDNE